MRRLRSKRAPLANTVRVSHDEMMKTFATTLTYSFTRLSAAVLIVATSACGGVAGTDAAPSAKPERAPVLAPIAAATPAPVPAPVSAAAPVDLMGQIKAEIGGAACDSNAQCRSLPVGQRACGGPEAYLPYSTKGTDAAKLQRIAEQQRAEQREKNTRSGMMSTCQAIMDPGATCSAGKCVSAKKDHLPLPTQ